MLSRGAIGAAHDGQAEGGMDDRAPDGQPGRQHVQEAPDREARSEGHERQGRVHDVLGVLRRTMSSWSV